MQVKQPMRGKMRIVTGMGLQTIKKLLMKHVICEYTNYSLENIYEALSIIAKRSNQINLDIKKELGDPFRQLSKWYPLDVRYHSRHYFRLEAL